MKKDIIVFDGLCVMCNSFLKWVLENDKDDKYLFANIQSDFYMKSMDINKSIDSIILIKENNIFYERVFFIQINVRFRGHYI